MKIPGARRLIVMLLLSFLPGLPAAGQDEPGRTGVIETVFLPPRFYVGDRVELRLRLQVGEGTRLEPVTLVTEKEWLSVEEVQVAPRGGGEAEVRIYFVSFYPGTTRLPELSLGDIRLADLDITTLSVLDRENGSRLRGPRGQLPLPGTRLKLAALLLAAVALPAGFYLLWRRLLAEARRLSSRRRRRRPYLRARRELRSLQQGLAGLDSRGFFIRLSRLLKAYLGERLALPVLSRTTRELAAASPRLSPGAWEEVTAVLGLSDLAKFSAHSSPAAEMAGTLKRVSDLIERLEEEGGDVES